MGRPTTLTPDVIKEICEWIASGNFRNQAAGAAGVSTRTFSLWCKRGEEEPESIYGELLRSVQVAEKKAETLVVQRILKLGQDDPAQLWRWLSLKFPQRWSINRQKMNDLAREAQELIGRVNAQLAQNAQRPEGG